MDVVREWCIDNNNNNNNNNNKNNYNNTANVYSPIQIRFIIILFMVKKTQLRSM